MNRKFGRLARDSKQLTYARANSAAVAGFGMLLRDSKFKNDLNSSRIVSLAKGSLGKDTNGYRQEFLQLVETWSLLKQ